LHWTGIAQRWQDDVRRSHSTDFETQPTHVRHAKFTRTFSEIDVQLRGLSDGPASLHVEMARNKSLFWDPPIMLRIVI